MKTLFFLHIPKTAGTTISHFVRSSMSWDNHLFVENPYEGIKLLDEKYEHHRPEYRFVHGHVHFGFCQRFSQQADQRFVFTVVRDPVQRFLSALGFMDSKIRYEGLDFTRSDFGLIDIVNKRSPDDWFLADNIMTRFLSSEWRGAAGGECTMADLAQAKHNLINHIDYCSFAEDITDLLELFEKIFNVTYDKLILNRTPRSLKFEDLSSQARDFITHYNRFDVELFDWATRSKSRINEKNARAAENISQYYQSNYANFGPGNDGDYLTLQNAIDESMSKLRNSHRELEERERLLNDLHEALLYIRSSKEELDNRISLLGNEINFSLDEIRRIETNLWSNNYHFDAKKRLISDLHARIQHLRDFSKDG